MLNEQKKTTDFQSNQLFLLPPFQNVTSIGMMLIFFACCCCCWKPISHRSNEPIATPTRVCDWLANPPLISQGDMGFFLNVKTLLSGFIFIFIFLLGCSFLVFVFL